MTCAGCPPSECPQDHWHLHVTVKPHWSWSLQDVASALQRDIERHDMRPVVVTNHFHADPSRNYKELIPTKHLRGTEAEAAREIFKMGVMLNNSGWRVKRLKIEGDARAVPPGRALYFESHIRSTHFHDAGAARAEAKGLPRSTNARGDVIYTVRHVVKSIVNCTAHDLTHDVRIEAIVLDTAPEMDREWMEQ